ERVVVAVLANDDNPFPDEGPLTIADYQMESGTGTVRREGETLVIVPAATMYGTLVVRYQIADVTGDVDRMAEGRVYVTVMNRPDAPPKPQIKSVESREVVLEWTAPPSNGSPIDRYEVTAPQGYAKTCASNTCVLDGLTNDQDYTFSVVAVNGVGPSDPSPLSDVATPDIRPDLPEAPVLEFGDKSLDVSWTTPPTE